MSVTEFLAEFEENDFPHPYGKWIDFDRFDPPYRRNELRDMRKLEVIQLDEKNKRFRLTLNAISHRVKQAA